jgi:ribosomal protein S12 methylthiotransferase
MGRKVTKQQLIDLIGMLRKEIPGVVIRTSLIVGLPGEGEKEFRELLNFMKDAKFERLGIFTYSKEEGTPAYNFKNQVSEKIKKQRFDEAMKLQQEIAKEVNASFLGKTMEVLIEEAQGPIRESGDLGNWGTQTPRRPEAQYIGRTYADAPEVDGTVFVNSKRTLKPGDFVDVKIVDTLEYDLVAEA